MTRCRLAQATTLIVLLFANVAGALEVAVLKSSDLPAWRPTLDALRRQTSAHTLTGVRPAGRQRRGCPSGGGPQGAHLAGWWRWAASGAGGQATARPRSRSST